MKADYKITLKSGKVVLLRKAKISDMRAANSVGDNLVEKAEEFLKNIIVGIGEKGKDIVPFRNTLNALDDNFDLAEFGEIQDAISESPEFMLSQKKSGTKVEKL